MSGALPASPTGYELIEFIDSGEMGQVYRARLLALGHEVAVKVPHPRHQNAPAVDELLIREAQITASLLHTSIPSAFGLDRMPDGRPYFAMQLIRGRTLAEAVEAHGLSDGLITAFETVCQAVGYAHSRGVIHCDLTPSNVMIGAFGEVVVIDWGLAKVMPGARVSLAMRDASDAPVRYGSSAYRSPEQACGDVGAISQRSDVFSLGGLLCALLTGFPPYLGLDRMEVRRLAVYAELSGAFRLLDGCGANSELVTLCKRCLSANPSDRPADALEVAGELARIREPE